jgi:hypothetical protein
MHETKSTYALRPLLVARRSWRTCMSALVSKPSWLGDPSPSLFQMLLIPGLTFRRTVIWEIQERKDRGDRTGLYEGHALHCHHNRFHFPRLPSHGSRNKRCARAFIPTVPLSTGGEQQEMASFPTVLAYIIFFTQDQIRNWKHEKQSDLISSIYSMLKQDTFATHQLIRSFIDE